MGQDSAMGMTRLQEITDSVMMQADNASGSNSREPSENNYR